MKTMKKAILIFGILATTFTSALANSTNEPFETLSKKEVKQMTQEESEERVLVLTERLEYLQSVENKDLDREERRAMKREVRDIEKELKAHNVGIYISGSALIIIILLIILL
jgi:diphthamide biosynthesis methyltransferase